MRRPAWLGLCLPLFVEQGCSPHQEGLGGPVSYHIPSEQLLLNVPGSLSCINQFFTFLMLIFTKQK